VIFRNFVLTRDDFEAVNWQEITAQAPAKQCYVYASLFAARVKEAEVAGDEKQQEIFTILVAATEPRLQVSRADMPYAPQWISREGRSFVPDDIPGAHLSVLRELAPSIADPEMRARISDILWIRKRDHQMAMLAVNSYLEAARALEHPVSWMAGRDRAYRAIQLAAPLGPNSSYFRNVVAYVEDVIDRFVGHEPELLPARMMDILLIHRTGDPLKNAEIAHRAATEAETNHDWDIAQDYWTIEATWHAINRDPVAERDSKIRAAETYVQLAERYAQSSPASYLSATAQVERAIEAYRRVGRCAERTDELRHVLDDYQQRSMSEMRSYEVKLPDTSELVRQSTDRVKDKPLEQALLNLAMIYQPPKMDELLPLAQQLSVESPINLLASSLVVDDQGHVVARDIGSLGDERGSNQVLGPELGRVAQTRQAFVTQAILEPARYQIITDHYVTLEVMTDLVSNNPFVPPGHEEIFARGLLAGFRSDFLVALSLLVPQIEQSIRYLLILSGVIPYGLDDNMIQQVHLLDVVLRRPETSVIFGEHIVFDLKLLLVNHSSSNLRNRLSHGLMKADEYDGWASVYLWWLVLHLCYRSFLIQQAQEASQQQENTSPGPNPPK
jgi:hypothetical protein